MGFEYHSLPPQNEKADAAISDTSSVTLEDPEEFTDPYEITHRRSIFEARLASRWLWLVHGLLLTISFSLFILSSIRTASTIEHVRKFSAWSPAETAVQYDHVKYNITTDANRFVGARPEVDEAWDEISYDMGDQWLSKDDISKLGMPETHLKVNHPVTGEEGYRVGMEVFHQLHCLNLLRRVTYRSYYEPLGGPFLHGQDALQAHTGKSINRLFARQARY